MAAIYTSLILYGLAVVAAGLGSLPIFIVLVIVATGIVIYG